MSDAPDLRAVYNELREYVIDVLAPLDDDARSTIVPACPEWTVHDLVAHVTHLAGAIAVGDHPFSSAERSFGADAAERARHSTRGPRRVSGHGETCPSTPSSTSGGAPVSGWATWSTGTRHCPTRRSGRS